jgi:hypothetical protein
MMKLRCKRGDIAVSDAGSTEDGKLVSILRAATRGDVANWEPATWFVESLGSPILTYTMAGEARPMRRRAIRDRELKPIRPHGDDEFDVRDVQLGERVGA